MSLRLITIPISHYCEKARWGLERAGLVYQEDAHLQMFHRLSTVPTGAGNMTPVLVHEDGAIGESSCILQWIDKRVPEVEPLFPDDRRDEVLALERELDEGLGVADRKWMYEEFLQLPDLVQKYNCTGVPRWQRAIFPYAVGIVGGVVKRYLGVTAETAIEGRQETSRAFDRIAELLSDGRPYLTGDTFTAADLTFSALAAPCLLPMRYGVPLPRVDELPKHLQLHIEAFREHPAGQFALRMYQQHR